MCFDERNTDRRARPCDFRLSVWRTRCARRIEPSFRAPISLLLLAFLAQDELASIADALALVRLGRPELPDLGRDLTDLLLVDSGDHDLGRLGTYHLDTLGNGKGHVMAVAELELEARPLHRRAVTHAGDFELLGEALGDAGHQVRDQRPRHTPHGAGILRVLAQRDVDATILELGDDVVDQDVLELALGS